MLEITFLSIFICICIKGNGGANKIRGNTGIARITPPSPNPGTLVDSTTKMRKYDLRHIYDKSEY